MNTLTRLSALSASLLVLCLPNAAHADEDATGDPTFPSTTAREAKSEAPSHAFTYDARGVTAEHYGANAYTQGLTGTSQNSLGGGVTAWGSPIDRLSIVVDAQRSFAREFSPSLAVLVRLAGGADGLSLSLLGKYKIEGFAHGPHDEVESELESGILLGYHRRAFHLDLNAITGFGLGDDGEIDGEVRLRAGWDATHLVRVGVDGQTRWRLHGTEKLPGNRTWDLAAGPQVVVGAKSFYGALTAGPTTMAVVDTHVGWFAFLSLGGVL